MQQQQSSSGGLQVSEGMGWSMRRRAEGGENRQDSCGFMCAFATARACGGERGIEEEEATGYVVFSTLGLLGMQHAATECLCAQALVHCSVPNCWCGAKPSSAMLPVCVQAVRSGTQAPLAATLPPPAPSLTSTPCGWPLVPPLLSSARTRAHARYLHQSSSWLTGD